MEEGLRLKGTRLDVALAVSAGPQTAHEIAKALGRPTGSIFGVLQRMRADELLKTDNGDDATTRGTQYRLTDKGRMALENPVEDKPLAGRLREHDRVLFVQRGDKRRKSLRVLAGTAVKGVVEWAVELPEGWLLVILQEAPTHRIATLKLQLEDSGSACLDWRIDSIVSGDLLQQRAQDLVKSG